MEDPTVEVYNSLIALGVQLQHIAVVAVLGVFFAWLALPYLKNQKWRAILAGVLYTGLTGFIYLIPEELSPPSGVNSLIRIAGGFIILYALDRSFVIQKFFLSLSYYTLSYTAIKMAAEQNSFFSDALYAVPTVIEDVDNTMVAFFIIEVEYVLFLILVLSVGIFFLHKACSFRPEELRLKDMLLLSIPPVMQIVQSFLFVNYYQLYTDYGLLLMEYGTEEQIRNLNWSNWLRFFDGLIFLIFWMAFLWLFSDFMKTSREKVELAVLTEQIEQVSKRVAHTESIQHQISGLRHDMSHHMMVISNLLEQDNVTEAKDYISHIETELQSSRPQIVTGHPVTDVILSEMEQEAKQMKLSFSCDFIFPKENNIDAFDLSVILGNGLSNAILSCEPNGGICVRGFIRQNIFLIEIRNTFSGEWKTDEQTGFPVTEKSADGHGLGLLNIKRVAQKYKGNVILEQKDGSAVLSVLLQTQPLP